MNNSVEYIIKRIQAENQMDNCDVNQLRKKALSIRPFEILSDSWKECKVSKSILKCNVCGTKISDGGSGTTEITIKYTPKAHFNFCISDICNHDGSLIFVQNGINTVWNKLLSLCRFQGNNNEPTDYRENIFMYNVTYSIGDFIVLVDCNKQYAPVNKPWQCAYQIVALPVAAIEYTKKTNIN